MLRDYQTDIINRVRNSFLENKKRVCVVLPTGTGKTVVFAHIAKMTS